MNNSLFKGFTLIEALAALLVLSIGLLGFASLQLQALRYAHSSYQRTLVNIQALDMAERMWTHLAEPLHELEEWRRVNRHSLPEWEGRVTAIPGQPGGYTMTISWRDERFAGSGADALSYWVWLPVLD